MPEAEPKIVYAPHSDATLRSELNALATVYKFVLSKRDGSQKGVELAPESDRRDDAKE